jgi:hypothetical protein
MADEVSAFLGRDAPGDGTECLPERIDGAQRHLAQQRLELGKGLLDRVQIGAIGWQIPHTRAGILDRLAHRGFFVRGQIVHHHDVVRLQGRHQDLLDIGQEQIGIDGAIEDRGCDQTILAQSGDEGGCLPVAVRAGIDQPGAALRAAIEPDHIGFCRGLIDENQFSRVEAGLDMAPLGSGFGNVGTVLLSGVQGLFFSVRLR